MAIRQNPNIETTFRQSIELGEFDSVLALLPESALALDDRDLQTLVLGLKDAVDQIANHDMIPLSEMTLDRIKTAAKERSGSGRPFSDDVTA